jgi:hydrogenase maturation factor
METDMMPVGKLDQTVLADLLGKYARPDERLLVGPSIGEDAAVFSPAPGYQVVSTDPITFATDRIGWYLVHVNANDIAVMGARPRFLLLTLLLPEGKATIADVEAMFVSVYDACQELDITLAGGHTEVTYGLDRTLAIGQMMGEVAEERLVRSSGARPGDAIILTKGIAIEGTAIIAREAADDLAARCGDDLAGRARRLLDDPGISVVLDARLACDAALPSAMHDPTEGGLATGLNELATASNVGMLIQEGAIPILPECRAACEAFSLDPLGLIASGALLVTAPPEMAERITGAFEEAGLLHARIGTIEEPEYGMKIVSDEKDRPLERFAVDEVTKLFSRR